MLVVESSKEQAGDDAAFGIRIVQSVNPKLVRAFPIRDSRTVAFFLNWAFLIVAIFACKLPFL